MSNEATGDKQAVKDTRALLNARFGEIVTGLIGDERAENIFNKETPRATGVAESFNTGSAPPEASGALAQKAEFVSAETKTALLIAQAAERTLRATEKVAFFTEQRDQIVTDLKQQIEDKQYAYATDFKAKVKEKIDQTTPHSFLQRIFQSHAERYALTQKERYALERGQRDIEFKVFADRQTELGYISANDSTFKYVGAAGDTPALQSAQATMLAAQMYLNNEIESRLYKSDFPLDIGVSAVGATFIDGLKQKAASDLKTASDILAQEGHSGAAARLNAVIASIGVDALPKSAPTPDILVKKMYEREESNVAYSNQQMSMWTMATFGHRAGFDKENCDRLIKLINPAGAEPAAPAQTAKAENAPAFKNARQ
ncbi:MAG: hypothetical protein Q8K65_10130 [Alphaproteobacteria bacterium]|nr:hypothetical protein [Alphaproteobacteria bacterium]